MPRVDLAGKTLVVQLQCLSCHAYIDSVCSARVARLDRLASKACRNLDAASASLS